MDPRHVHGADLWLLTPREQAFYDWLLDCETEAATPPEPLGASEDDLTLAAHCRDPPRLDLDSPLR